MGGRGTAGAGAGGGGGGGVGRAQVRIAAPARCAAAATRPPRAAPPARSWRSSSATRAAVRFCYNRLLAKRAGASGQIVIRLTVAGDGSVSEATSVRSTLGRRRPRRLRARPGEGMGASRPSTEARFTFDVPFVFTPPADGEPLGPGAGERPSRWPPATDT
jgi:hypothetical protein